MDTQDLDGSVAGSNGVSPEQAPHSQSRILHFQPRSLNAETNNAKSLLHSEQSGGTDRRVAQLISKHAPRNWRPNVGARVAALSEGRIILGIVLGVQRKPWRVASFSRAGFSGCWVQVDNGKKLVANELRPVQEIKIVKEGSNA